MLNSKLQRIFALVGEATSIWNQVEEIWFLLFTGLLATTPRAITDTIYEQFQTGAMQRKLIMAVAPVALKPDIAKIKARDPAEHLRRRILRRIGQLNAQTSDLSGKRNAVIHSSFEIFHARVPPHIVAISPHKISKLNNEDHETYLTYLNQDLNLLLLDMLELRELLIELNEGIGSRKVHYEFLRQRGLIVPVDEWAKERALLLKSVKARNPPP